MNNSNKSRNTHWKNLFHYEYIGSHNLQEGEEIVCTIKEVKMEEITGDKGKKDNKPVIYFVEDRPKMILNKTNAGVIEKIHSPYIEEWPCKKIQLFATQVAAFGEMKNAIRIRGFVPKEEVKVDVDAALTKLGKAKDTDQLKEIWGELSAAEKNHKDIQGLKDELKDSMTGPL